MKCYKSVFNQFLLLFIFFYIGYCKEIFHKTQDGYLIENELQGSEHEIKLEDFFWTGSGDGPPAYLKRPIVPLSESTDIFGRETIVRTATVFATVYIDGQLDPDELCIFDCHPTDNETEVFKPADRRYWLLTIISGFFGQNDYPLLATKLAKLYRIAFSRQQARHLGINNTTLNYLNKKRRRRRSTKILFHKYQIKPSRTINKTISETYKKHYVKRSIVPKDYNISSSTINQDLLTQNNIDNANEHVQIPKVSILIHNITFTAEDDLKESANKSFEYNYNTDLVISNQTEIIYTVFVGRRPVLALTASEDMKLVSEDEVALIMENKVFTKSEPYLKEPQATPLIPANHKNNSNLVSLLVHNPVMFIILGIGIFLVLILFIGLILMTHSKRKRSAELKRILATQKLPFTAKEKTGIENIEEDIGGIDNSAFEKNYLRSDEKYEQQPPDIQFPRPPVLRPSSSTSSTSDSSIYYPKRHSKLTIQNDAIEKNEQLLHKKKRRDHNLDLQHKNIEDEDLYTSIAKKEKKRDKNKKRYRRKYMMENKVGSIEEVAQIHSSQTSTDNDNPFEVSTNISALYEHNEAFNINLSKTHYHRNKLLQNATFVSGIDLEADTDKLPYKNPTEAINRELLKINQKNDRSSADSGSIGSFLSMNSVRSFPRYSSSRCGVPEPLSRVLEPVTVTHLDQYDCDVDTIRYSNKKIIQKTNKKYLQSRNDVVNEIHLVRSQSDGSDPGVVGPIVWELHKKEHENDGTVASPLRDPALTRNRFEGLLEGVIKLYDKQNDDNFNETINPIIECKNLRPNDKDFRGKSAVTIKNVGNLSRCDSGNIRPFTADASKIFSTHSTQPPTPSKKAWRSGAPSPLVRPMSAGPFHKPTTLPTDINTNRSAVKNAINGDEQILSAAPLIEAIQNELKRFNNNSNTKQ